PPEWAAPAIDAITPVYFLHARAAARCGFVTFDADADGVIRRMRLFQRRGDDVLSQLALALAADEIGARADDFAFSKGRVRMTPHGDARAARTFQLDRDGYTLAPWVAGDDWRRQFRHIPAGLIWSVYHRRLLIQQNRQAIRAGLAEILSDPFFPEHERHAADVRDLQNVRSQLRLAEYAGDRSLAEALRPMVEQLESMIAERERKGVERLRGAAESSHDAHVQELVRRLSMLDPYYESNAEIQRSLDDLTERLRDAVGGRICLIGYTATSLADMKPIPTHPGAPGVMAHANLLNGILTNRLMRWTTTPVNLLLAAVCGLWAVWLTVFHAPREAAAGVTVSILAVLAAAWAAFRWWNLWVTVTPAIGAMLLAFVTITVFVYIFVDRERRQLSTALEQYTSREIARQISENPELCRRAEVREVTAMFTDLKGFTTISERIGAERTQAVLNKCLGLFTDVMLRHEALVSKFMGDGVFAFWNPVIYPQPDHARRACETAVDLSRALDEFKSRQRQEGGDEVFQELVLRIGVATGSAVVGPCGSEQKYDYTCIGDSVNLASRLESANKAFGTLRLVGGVARDQAGDGFAFRPLGALRVKGKAEAAPVYELLGRREEVDAGSLEYAERFGTAVALFARREFAAALEEFEACAAQHPDDSAAELYIRATRQLLASPPGDDWSGAIELTEK
ncbi:MAG: CHASE2 domain-containing protein, partial [Planctomycetota bacterium]